MQEKILIQMKTDDMVRHCNLLFNRILAECNVSVKNSKDKEMLVYEEGGQRLIAFSYIVESSSENKESIWKIRIILIDNGQDHASDCCYYDEESMSIVHDVAVYATVMEYNGEKIDFDDEKLIEINKQVLKDLRKPLNIGWATIINEHLLYPEMQLIAIDKNVVNEQLKATTLQFMNKYKEVFPEELCKKIVFVDNGRDLYNPHPKGYVKADIEERVFTDCIWTDDNDEEAGRDATNEYMIWLYAANETHMCIRLREVKQYKGSSLFIYHVEDIVLTKSVGNGYFLDSDFEDKVKAELLSGFNKINHINFPKYSRL